MRVLTVNAGSSSLKLRLLDADDTVLADRELPPPGRGSDDAALVAALRDGLGEADAVGHRVVHGGETFAAPVRVDAEVRRTLDTLTDLAPLHQPKSLAALDAVSRALPGLPAVACFDTAFHRTIPAAAATYALPAAWRARWPLQRFGFHGLSHAYVAQRTAELVGADDLRVVSCHLGAGASLCAIAGGRSVDTTMGFTPLEGLVMATRSGSIDPGLPLWLIEHAGLEVRDVAHALEHGSGLLGLAGDRDMRALLEREDDDARLALEVYLHRLRAGIAAMAAALGGLDVLAFTGGVGEHAPEVRRRACDGLGFLGVAVDTARNDAATGEAVVTRDDGRAAVVVVPAREDLQLARGARATL